MSNTALWQTRHVLHPRESEGALDRQMEIARRQIAAQLLKVTQPGQLYTVRWDVGAKPYWHPYHGGHYLPGREVVGELEVTPVVVTSLPLRMVGYEAMPLRDLTRSATQELRHRARRAVSRAWGRVAFWRKR